MYFLIRETTIFACINSFIMKNDKLKVQAINGTRNMTYAILQDKQLRILRVYKLVFTRISILVFFLY